MRLLGLLILIGSTIVTAQPAYYATYSPGYFLNHSENDQPVTGRDKLQIAQGGVLGVIYPLKGYRHLEASIGYERTNLNHPHSLPQGYPEPYNLWETSFPVTLRLFISSSELTGYGLGLIWAGTNHGMEIENPMVQGDNVRDVFNSQSLGCDGYVRFSWNIQRHVHLMTDLTLRYLQGFQYRGVDRDFSDYQYHYTQLLFSMGLGYK